MIPIIISICFVLNTMIGSIYERKREIAIYTMWGLLRSVLESWITLSAGLLEKIQPALLNAADTGALQLDESILQEIMSLMDEVKPYTSLELSQFIDTVQSRLQKRQAMTPQDE